MKHYKTDTLDLRLMDCMELMKEYPDKHFDLAIVDPPYGINIAKEKPRVSGRWNYIPKQWDSAIPDKRYFEELERVSKERVIWGGNYFPLPPSRCWIVWDKEQPVDNFSDAELAWTSLDEVVSMFRFSFAANKDKIHPTQKPVALYRWLLANYAKVGMKILDTHLGSMSHAIAAHYSGVHLTGCELDPDYFAAGIARVKAETAQMDMFADSPKSQQTETMKLL
jgi:site-specific DNA-methyltransferase (adenine-specific)